MKAILEDHPAPLAMSSGTRTLSDIIVDRRSTERFGPNEVLTEDLNEILRLGAQAPSGFNLQPWRFIVVRDAENKRKLQRAAMNQERIAEAGVVIIALGMKAEWKRLAEDVMRDARRSKGTGPSKEAAMEFLTKSTLPLNVWVTRQTMIAFTTMMLIAEAFGYETTPMEGFDPDAIRKEFEIPDEAEVVALLAIGKTRVGRKPGAGGLKLDRLVFNERFGEKWKGGIVAPPRNGQPKKVKCCGEAAA